MKIDVGAFDDIEFLPFDIDELTKESIIEPGIFKYIFSMSDNTGREKMIVQLEEKARELKFTSGFKKMYKAYRADFERQLVSGANIMQFTDAPVSDLKCGLWECKDTGVTRQSLEGIMVQACPHPILIMERLKNIDTETEKVRLVFKKDGRWQNFICDKLTISTRNKIVDLSDKGIEVTSESSKDLVNYLSDAINLNTALIPLTESITRCGWLKGNKFSPFCNIKYDGDVSFKDLFDSLKTKGNYDLWKTNSNKLRMNKYAHITMATSFASVLIQPLGINPFVFHLWGGTGAGKTVALMVAMSIWGNPAMGKLVRSLNMTQVAIGRTLGFLNNLPFAGDEFQIIKNKFDNMDNLIMFLTEGVDKGRGKAYGGTETLLTWQNCCMFTGEEPVVKGYSGGGVKNRVLEIECIEKVIEDGYTTSGFVKNNYGFAGKEFIEYISKQKDLKAQYAVIQKEVLSKYDTSEKQAMVIACIILADQLSQFIFNDGNVLKVDDFKNYIQSNTEINMAERAYEMTLNWLAMNTNRFSELDNRGELWGKLEDEKYCLVNKDVLVRFLNNENISFDAVKKKWEEKDYIELSSQGRYLIQTKVFGVKANYVKILFKKEFEQVDIDDGELPFKE